MTGANALSGDNNKEVLYYLYFTEEKMTLNLAGT